MAAAAASARRAERGAASDRAPSLNSVSPSLNSVSPSLNSVDQMARLLSEEMSD